MFEDDFIEMLQKYPDAVKDKKVFVGLLKDYFPEQQMQVNLINNLFVMGIAEDIQNATLINNAFAFRFVKALMDNHGVSRINADWAASVWCVCYGQKILHKQCDIKLGAMKSGAAPVIEDSSANKGQQYNDLFQYVKTNGGYEVCGFTGNKKTIIFQNQYQNHAVVAVKEKAFIECEVEEVIMTEGYEKIRDRAFQGCEKLHQVVLSATLKEIMPYAFQGCGSLNTIMLPSALQVIGDYALASTGLKRVDIPGAVYWIGKGAFSHCKNLTNVALSNNIVDIPDEMFFGCENLKSLELPENIQKIGARTFKDCSNLDFLAIPDGVTDIGDEAFENVHEKFILQCSMGSYAEEYARGHKIKYQLV